MSGAVNRLGELVRLAKKKVPVIGHPRTTEHGVTQVKPHMRTVDVGSGGEGYAERTARVMGERKAAQRAAQKAFFDTPEGKAARRSAMAEVGPQLPTARRNIPTADTARPGTQKARVQVRSKYKRDPATGELLGRGGTPIYGPELGEPPDAFVISGTDTRGRRVKIGVPTREEADRVVARIKAGDENTLDISQPGGAAYVPPRKKYKVVHTFTDKNGNTITSTTHYTSQANADAARKRRIAKNGGTAEVQPDDTPEIKIGPPRELPKSAAVAVAKEMRRERYYEAQARLPGEVSYQRSATGRTPSEADRALARAERGIPSPRVISQGVTEPPLQGPEERRMVTRGPAGDWEYEDARGVKKRGTFIRSVDRGGTDVTYFFRGDDGRMDVVSGERLKKAHRAGGAARTLSPEDQRAAAESMRRTSEEVARINRAKQGGTPADVSPSNTGFVRSLMGQLEAQGLGRQGKGRDLGPPTRSRGDRPWSVYDYNLGGVARQEDGKLAYFRTREEANAWRKANNNKPMPADVEARGRRALGQPDTARDLRRRAADIRRASVGLDAEQRRKNNAMAAVWEKRARKIEGG